MSLRSSLAGFFGCGKCDKEPDRAASTEKTLVIIGSPNVGKSVVFNQLAGIYATVANYPGTTVECEYGKARIGNHDYRIIDTPGTYSLLPISEEERIARKILIEGRPDIVLNIVDAKNLTRMLHLTIQLIEANLPVILVLNMTDEAENLGININTRLLENLLGIPVVPTTAVTGKGLEELRRKISETQVATAFTIDYGAVFNTALEQIAAHLTAPAHFHKRFLALLVIQDDRYLADFSLAVNDGMRKELAVLKLNYSESFSVKISQKRKDTIDAIIARVFEKESRVKAGLLQVLDFLTFHPVWGSLILLSVLYYGLYQVVGVFGAGTLVDFLENDVFANVISPFFINLFNNLLGFPGSIADPTLFQKIKLELFNLIVGEYGIITLGLSYAIAIVLPIVSLFFIFFSILEDTGYLPRLASMLDILCKRIGLNGRAVIPLILGLGCDTMATLSTRILETKRERFIATFLLALTIPCSAQLGVILCVLSVSKTALIAWAVSIFLIFLISGVILDAIIPGRKQSFYLEIPPLRMPKLYNIFIKTYTRILWYLGEVVPLFVFASVFIWFGQLTKLFDLLIRLFVVPVRLIGLPDEAAKIFLFGFFRRDYGAAGLYDLNGQGLLTVKDLIVSAIVLTLFIPCIAQFLIMKKEQGLRKSLEISAIIFIVAFSAGFLVNQILMALNIG